LRGPFSPLARTSHDPLTFVSFPLLGKSPPVVSVSRLIFQKRLLPAAWRCTTPPKPPPPHVSCPCVHKQLSLVPPFTPFCPPVWCSGWRHPVLDPTSPVDFHTSMTRELSSRSPQHLLPSSVSFFSFFSPRTFCLYNFSQLNPSEYFPGPPLPPLLVQLSPIRCRSRT